MFRDGNRPWLPPTMGPLLNYRFYSIGICVWILLYFKKMRKLGWWTIGPWNPRVGSGGAGTACP